MNIKITYTEKSTFNKELLVNWSFLFGQYAVKYIVNEWALPHKDLPGSMLFIYTNLVEAIRNSHNSSLPKEWIYTEPFRYGPVVWWCESEGITTLNNGLCSPPDNVMPIYWEHYQEPFDPLGMVPEWRVQTRLYHAKYVMTVAKKVKLIRPITMEEYEDARRRL